MYITYTWCLFINFEKSIFFFVGGSRGLGMICHELLYVSEIAVEEQWKTWQFIIIDFCWILANVNIAWLDLEAKKDVGELAWCVRAEQAKAQS